MTEWKARRFWTASEVVAEEGGWGIRLDGRPVRTPGKLPLAVPTRTLADAIAREWDAQAEVIDPLSMPFTRMANSAIEKVTPKRMAVIEELAGYGDSDLTCYRADGPEPLVERQEAAWDPLLDWAAQRYGARLLPVIGVMHQPQPPAALSALAAPVARMDAFALTSFHDLVALSGSLVIALAVTEGHLSPAEAWRRSRIDEIWQQEQWGEDAEAAAAAEVRRADFLRAHRFWTSLHG